MLAKLEVRLLGGFRFRQPRLVVLAAVGLVHVRGFRMLAEKSDRVGGIGERRRGRRQQAVAGDEVEARGTVVLHGVGVLPTAEYRESLPAQQLVLLDAMILVPDPVGVSIAMPVVHDGAKWDLHDEAIAHEVVATSRTPVVDAAIRDDHLVPLVDQSEGESQAGEMTRGDDEAHANGIAMHACKARRVPRTLTDSPAESPSRLDLPAKPGERYAITRVDADAFTGESEPLRNARRRAHTRKAQATLRVHHTMPRHGAPVVQRRQRIADLARTCRQS